MNRIGEHIPDDLLIPIFTAAIKELSLPDQISALCNKIGLVCKKWNQNSQSNLLWIPISKHWFAENPTTPYEARYVEIPQQIVREMVKRHSEKIDEALALLNEETLKSSFLEKSPLEKWKMVRNDATAILTQLLKQSNYDFFIHFLVQGVNFNILTVIDTLLNSIPTSDSLSFEQAFILARLLDRCPDMSRYMETTKNRLHLSELIDLAKDMGNFISIAKCIKCKCFDMIQKHAVISMMILEIGAFRQSTINSANDSPLNSALIFNADDKTKKLWTKASEFQTKYHVNIFSYVSFEGMVEEFKEIVELRQFDVNGVNIGNSFPIYQGTKTNLQLAEAFLPEVVPLLKSFGAK